MATTLTPADIIRTPIPAIPYTSKTPIEVTDAASALLHIDATMRIYLVTMHKMLGEFIDYFDAIPVPNGKGKSIQTPNPTGKVMGFITKESVEEPRYVTPSQAQAEQEALAKRKAEEEEAPGPVKDAAEEIVEQMSVSEVIAKLKAEEASEERIEVGHSITKDDDSETHTFHIPNLINGETFQIVFKNLKNTTKAIDELNKFTSALEKRGFKILQ